jgi:hypothetical protein
VFAFRGEWSHDPRRSKFSFPHLRQGLWCQPGLLCAAKATARKRLSYGLFSWRFGAEQCGGSLNGS